MKPDWNIIDLARLGDSLGSWRSLLLPNLQKLLLNTRVMLSNGLTFRDNMNVALVTLGTNPDEPLTHGVEYLLRNPLRSSSKPIGFLPLLAFDDKGAPAELAGPPGLDLTRDDGLIGVTCRFAAPCGAVTAYRNTAQSIATATPTAVSFAGTESTEGSAITWVSSAPTRLTFSRPGRVFVCHENIFNIVAAGTYRLHAVCINAATGILRAYDYDSGTAYAGLTGSDEITVAEGDYIESYVAHDRGANLDVCAFGDATRSRLTARYVGPAFSTGTVTGILVGG
jgi:hypothetical protein